MNSPPSSSEPNPEAIAWYVEEAQRLLEDQQRRAESLRTRGGQIAGFGALFSLLSAAMRQRSSVTSHGAPHTIAGLALLAAAVCLGIAVAIAISGAIRPRAYASISADEVVNYATDRFLHEPDLWRVHVRSLKALGEATESAQEAGNSAAAALVWSLWAFLAGLAFSLIAIATLLGELI